MVTHMRLNRQEHISNSLIGITLAEIDALYAEFEIVHQVQRSKMTTQHKDG